MLPLRKHKVKLGSPPRGRGKGKDYATAETMQGITPAWAGKRSPHRSAVKACQDHPRVGGEKGLVSTHFKAKEGSPPRGRGKVLCSSIALACAGITPAWAGKSLFKFSEIPPGQDHPRVGGEKVFEDPIIQRNWGSPPRGRGKAKRSGLVDTKPRITPAWAGKS